MKYMLDTNICIYAIKNKPPEVIRNFLQHNPDDMCISSITYGELMHGVEKSQAVEKNRIAMSLFLSPITILDFESYAAEGSGGFNVGSICHDICDKRVAGTVEGNMLSYISVYYPLTKNSDCI